LAAARPAEQVSGYAEAAVIWQRAIVLCHEHPDAAGAAGIDVPRVYVQAIDTLYLAGDGDHAGMVADEACRRFADHPDPATAAIACHRAAILQALDSPAAGLLLIEEALRLFEQAPPSADQALAWSDYADHFLFAIEGRAERISLALNRALEIAEAVGAADLLPIVLAQ